MNDSAAPSKRPLSVELCGVAKRYLLFGRRRDRAMALIGRTRRLTRMTALQGIDLEVAQGEAVGIVGENGSGKSTLLRLVAGISTPDEGTVRVTGPVAPILELGLGFHPEFTGRQNAILYGALLGIGEQVMKERLGDVFEFAELGEFADQPLRTYSSGMAARLAFAVATNVDPQVLVVDEALAVGDGGFQKKCVDRMVRFKDRGRTVLFCSHAMYQVTSFCERAVWLHHGRVRMEGRSHEVAREYEEYLLRRGKRPLESPAEAGGAHGGGSSSAKHGSIESIRVEESAGRAAGEVPTGGALEVEVSVRADAPQTEYHVGVAFDTSDGRCLVSASTYWDGLKPMLGRQRYRVRLRVPSFPAGAGSYVVSAFLFDETGLHIYDQAVLPEPVRVTSERWTGSLVVVPHDWRVEE